MAAITDLLTQATSGTRPSPTTLSAILASGSSPGTATCAALTGWPTTTAVHFIIYTTDSSGNKILGSQTDWKGVVSGTTITSLVLKAGTNTGYSIGAIVEAAPTAAWADDLYSWGIAQHNEDGSHGAITATSINVSSTVTLPSASISQTALPLGAVVQVASTNFSAVATGTTTIPADDTIPQITEGTEFMTQTITPKSATNTLIIEATITASHTGVDFFIAALFQDATTNAIAAVADYGAAVATGTQNLFLRYTMVAGTTSSTTFRVRLGTPSANTVTFNGQSGGRLFGGITLSNMRITEHKS